MPSNRNLADLGASIDSGIAGEFLTVGDSGGLFRNPAWTEIASKPTTLDSAVAIALIDSAYIQARQTDVGLDSALTTSLVDSAYIQARSSVTGLDSAGAINLIDSAYLEARVSGGLDSAGVTGIVDSAYVSARASVNSGFGTYTYFATAGQTDFSGSDVDGNVLAYTADGIIVWYNGVQMLDTDDYTASNGTSVSLTRGADSGSSLVIGKWALASSSSSSASSFAWGGDRGITAAGSGTSGTSNTIDYFDITSAGNATDFGDTSSAASTLAAISNASRIVIGAMSPSNTQGLEYITSSTTGNTTDFGDLIQATGYCGAVSNGTRGVWGSRLNSGAMEYITIANTGNATSFGSLDSSNYFANNGPACGSDGSRGLFAGNGSGSSITNEIQYITIDTTGNATDFGTLTTTWRDFYGFQKVSDATRTVFGGGFSTGGSNNTIDYVTTGTAGNATDFGDMITGVQGCTGTSNGTVGVWMGGFTSTHVNTIQSVTIQTPANAVDFGDLTVARYQNAGSSGAAA